MNERIKELAEQAGWSDWTDDDNWIYPLAQERGYFILKDLEKFAELIINDCLMLCEEWIEIDKDLKKRHVGVDPEIGPEFCIGSIKEYFGVKE